MARRVRSAVVLSMREVEILNQLALGRSDKEIAVMLAMSPNTVRTHLKRLYSCLGARNRAHAVALVHFDRGAVDSLGHTGGAGRLINVSTPPARSRS